MNDWLPLLLPACHYFVNFLGFHYGLVEAGVLNSNTFCIILVRVYGGDDIKSSICVSEHILKERDEGQVC